MQSLQANQFPEEPEKRLPTLLITDLCLQYNLDEPSPGSPPVPHPYTSQGAIQGSPEYQIAILRTRGITGGKNCPVNLVQNFRLVLSPRPGGSSKPATEIRSANGIPYPALGDHTSQRDAWLWATIFGIQDDSFESVAPSGASAVRAGPSPDTSGGDAVMG